MRTAALVFVAALTLSCAEETVIAPADGPTWHADIEPIVAARCAGCHQAGEIGPFPLQSYAEVFAVRELVAEVVSAQTMPPWSADPDRQFKYDPSLTAEQIDTVAAWVSAGAPEGDPERRGEPLETIPMGLSRVDLTMGMAEPYVPSVTPDEYRCFILDWPATETVYVTGFAARPGNTSIDHHVAAFLVTPDNVLGQAAFDGLAQLDADDPRPGYECFGGPAGESDLQIPAMQIGQWVPGQGGGDFPAGTGIKVPPGSKVVLQMHYNLSLGAGAADQTELLMKIDSTVDREAAFAPWLNVAWVDGGMSIPAFQSTTHTHTGDPRGWFSIFAGDTDVSNGFRIHGAMLHMHKLGTAASVSVIRQDGSREVILSISDYDFNWQRLYELAEPVDFLPGDELSVECHWENTPERQGGAMPVDVNWGEGSGEEMCVANLYVSEP